MKRKIEWRQIKPDLEITHQGQCAHQVSLNLADPDFQGVTRFLSQGLLSRIIDFDNYTINDDVFQILDVRWGPHTIDGFACSYNAKLSRFNSRFYQPGTEAVDAFLQDWEFEKNWLLPPVFQIARVVDHLRLCNAEDTVVIPMWKSSYFWALLCNDGRHWNSFVNDWVVLLKFKQLFVRGKAKNDMFGVYKRVVFCSCRTAH